MKELNKKTDEWMGIAEVEAANSKRADKPIAVAGQQTRKLKAAY